MVAASTETPGYGGTVIVQNFYNNLGQLVKTSKTGQADALFEYDAMGSMIRSGLDVDADGSLVLASTDRIQDSDASFSLESGDWFQVSTSKVYGSDNDSTPTTVSMQKSRLTGLPSPSVSESVSVDVYGNSTTSTTSIDRTNKTVVQTIDVPDSNIDVLTVSVNGLKTSERTKTNLTYTFAYDALGRQTAQTDPRTGSSSVAYNALGQVSSVTDAASNSTAYAYESTTGRKSSETDALGNTTLYTYDAQGQITAIRGTAQYPIDYVYDSYGKMTQMKSYRDSSLSTPDVTTWTYDTATGLLSSKTDAAGKSVSYTYSADGKLLTRTWARNVMTSYSYNLAGNLTAIDYSDTTPDVSMTYNRLGQKLTVSDAAGTRTLSYNEYLAPSSETSSGLYSKTLSHSYDALGRTSGTTLDATQMAAYSYDATGRFSGMTIGSNSLTYSFLSNSNLISSVSRSNNKDTAYSYEANRDLLTQVAHGSGLSAYGYTNDAVGRRTSMSRSGSVFANPDVLNYGYNSKSELTSAQSTADPDYIYGYSYDSIGNRLTSSERGAASTYTSNNLNQYTAIDISTPTYDYDGNMLTDGMGWAFAWDAESRIATQQSGSQRIDCKYDYASRRVEKKVYSSGTLTKHLKFVYKGFRLIQVLDGLNSDAALQEFTWSLDDKLQTFTNKTTGITYFAHSDGNRNVTELTAADGSLGAHYKYGPYGQLLEASGPVAYVNPFRFSSEYHDDETGLVYYNYRYYSPKLGRWLSKDPIGEKMAWNLYAFVTINNPVSLWDNMGLRFEAEGSPDFVKRVEQALNKVEKALEDNVNKAKTEERKRKAEEALERFKKLRYCECAIVKVKDARLVIDPKWKDRDRYESKEKVIYWNPDDDSSYIKEYAGEKVNNDEGVGIAHESFHAYEDIIERVLNDNIKRRASNKKDYPNKAEENAVDFENHYRSGRGLDIRKGYW